MKVSSDTDTLDELYAGVGFEGWHLPEREQPRLDPRLLRLVPLIIAVPHILVANL